MKAIVLILGAFAALFACGDGYPGQDMIERDFVRGTDYSSSFADTDDGFYDQVMEGFREPTDAELQAELAKLDEPTGGIGQLEQPLVFSGNYGQSMENTFWCSDHSAKCMYPAQHNLVIRTCVSQFVSNDRKQQIQAAVNSFASEMNAVQNTDFSFTVAHDNCTDPQNGQVISVRSSPTSGGPNVFGQHDPGSQLVLPWKSIYYYRRNTIHIDLFKIATAAGNLGMNGTQQLTLIFNVVRHELGHAVGLGHDPNTPPAFPTGPHLMKQPTNDYWNYVGIFTGNEKTQTAVYQP